MYSDLLSKAFSESCDLKALTLRLLLLKSISYLFIVELSFSFKKLILLDLSVKDTRFFKALNLLGFSLATEVPWFGYTELAWDYLVKVNT